MSDTTPTAPPAAAPAPSSEQVMVELLRVQEVLRAAGVEPGADSNGTIAECVANLVLERQQLRLRLALVQPVSGAAPPEQPAAKEAPPK